MDFAQKRQLIEQVLAGMMETKLLLTSGHCEHPISGELTKTTKSGVRQYVYYRCTRNSREGHPRIRVTEVELDRQMLALFDRMRVEDPDDRD